MAAAVEIAGRGGAEAGPRKRRAGGGGERGRDAGRERRRDRRRGSKGGGITFGDITIPPPSPRSRKREPRGARVSPWREQEMKVRYSKTMADLARGKK